MAKSIETIGLKNISIDFLNNEIQHLFVVQGDTKTRGLLVRIKDNNGNTILASTEYELRLYAKYADEAKLLYSVADIVDEQYRVYLTTDMLRKVGTLIIQLALYKDNVELIQSKQSSLQVHPSMTCQIDVGEDKVIDIIKMQESLEGFEEKIDKLKNFDGFDGLADLKKGEEERKQAERLRVLEESKRSENESTRKDNEDKRIESEKQRESSELSRIENEKQRVSNEENRKANEEKRIASDDERKQKYELYQSNEEKRIEQENARASKEELRISEEQKRSEQESSRVKADQERNSKEIERSSNEEKRSQQESERVQAEQTRISNEQNRGEAEQVRINNEEERKTNELNRIEAEKQRQTKDSERDIKFGEWNKKIESLGNTPGELPEIPKIERATETTAGVVKLKGLSEEDDTAVSYNLYNKAITDISSNTDSKLEQQNTTITEKLSEQDSKVDTKLKEYDANVEKNTTGISDIKTKLLEQDKTIQGQDTKIIGINEKLSTTDTDIKGLKDTTQSLSTKTDELSENIESKATKEEVSTLTTELKNKATKEDISTLTSDLELKATKEDIDTLTNQISTKANQKDVDALTADLSSKANKSHTHEITDITNLETKLAEKANQEDIDKLSTELTEKMNSFSVAPATREKAGTVKIDVDGESTAISRKTYLELVDDLIQIDNTLRGKLGVYESEYLFRSKADKSELNKKSDIGHTHSIADVTDLQTVLDKKLEATDITELSTKVDINTTEISDTKNIANANSKSISGLTNELDKKAGTSHTHAISNITNLQTALDNKVSKTDISTLQSSIDGKASKSHTHSISDISNLQYTLNNKASASDLSSLEAKVNNLSTDKISNKNGGSLSFWTGTESEYNSIYSKDSNTIYFITE